MQKIIVGIYRKKSRKTRVPGLSEKHGVGRGRACDIVRSVVEEHIEVHHILARSYKYILGRHLGEIVPQAQSARRHTDRRHGSHEEHVGDRQKLADKLVSTRKHRLRAYEFGIRKITQTSVYRAVLCSPSLYIVYCQRRLYPLCFVQAFKSVGIAIVKYIVNIKPYLQSVFLHFYLSFAYSFLVYHTKSFFARAFLFFVAS